LMTAFVVVPKFEEREFLSCYETLGPMVVPQSGKKLAEDNDFHLYGVTLFKKKLDEFKTGCREKRFTVREYKYDPEEAERDSDEYSRLLKDSQDQWSTFMAWTDTAFGEVFAGMIHIKILRAFVESVLRYGLPVNFDMALLRLSEKSASRLRTVLKDMFAHLGGSWAAGGDQEVTVIPGVTSEKDFYPYVSVDVPLPDTSD